MTNPPEEASPRKYIRVTVEIELPAPAPNVDFLSEISTRLNNMARRSGFTILDHYDVHEVDPYVSSEDAIERLRKTFAAT